MQKALQHLIELQEIEKRIQSLAKQKASIPKQIAALQDQKDARVHAEIKASS